MSRHFLELDDVSAVELDQILAMAEAAELGPVLAGNGVALVFEKPSNRTRNSTEMAVVGLGGHPVYIPGHEVGLDMREPAADVARTLASYHRIICARVFDHGALERMADALDGDGTEVPVVNLLSDRAHPCQAVADLLTLRDAIATVKGGDGLVGHSLAYVGDANNVCRSLAMAAVMVGMDVRVAAPDGYQLLPGDLDWLEDAARAAGRSGSVEALSDPFEAVDGVDAIYTDVWTSMGQEAESLERLAAFEGYCVDDALLEAAGEGAVVLHCLPAHRGEEIAASVVDGERSVVWRQAAHRRTAMRGILAWLVATPAERAGVLP